MLNLRKEIQIVFQDPFSSLSPRMNIEDIISEGLLIHYPSISKKEKEIFLKNGNIPYRFLGKMEILKNNLSL